MSEDVKPKQLWISKRKAPILFSGINVGTMTYAFSYKPRDSDILARPGDIIPFIELEPTMRMMDELADALEFYSNKTKLDCGEMAFVKLEKYRKFKEGLR